MLGVAIDDEINFTKHICSKGARQVGVLMRVRNLTPTSATLRVYEYFILPYYHIVWHHCCLLDEVKVERFQERALGAIYCGRSSTYEAVLNEARLPTLRNRRLQDIAIFNNYSPNAKLLWLNNPRDESSELFNEMN